MKHSHRIKQWLWVGIGIVVFVSLPLPFLMEAVGFYTLHPGWEVAEILAKKGRSVEGCKKIYRAFWWDVLSPPVSEQRSLCVFQYAALTKDPTACELLMPSEYGLSCIGEIWGKIIDETNCHRYQENSIRCFIGKDLVPQITVCDALAKSNECLHRRAEKEKDESLCMAITHSTLRSVCQTRVRFLKKYPQSITKDYFPDYF